MAFDDAAKKAPADVTGSGWLPVDSKIDGQISQLVQAMATYPASRSGFDPTSTIVDTLSDETMFKNALAAAWHR